MFYISNSYGDGTYGVTDSADMVEERYSLNDLISLPSNIKVIGVSRKDKKVTAVYNSMQEIYDVVMARFKLTHPELAGLCRIECRGNDIYLFSVNEKVKDFKIPNL